MYIAGSVLVCFIATYAKMIWHLF